MGLQAIYLDPKTGAKATNLPVAKQTFGVTKGIPVTFNHHAKTSMSFIAEGPETGLSVLAAYPKAQVSVTLGKGKMPSVDPSSLARQVVLVGDNDGTTNLHRDYEKAAERFKQAGNTVWLVLPKQAGMDFNDIHQQQGLEAVRQQVVQGKLMGVSLSKQMISLTDILKDISPLSHKISIDTMKSFHQQRQQDQVRSQHQSLDHLQGSSERELSQSSTSLQNKSIKSFGLSLQTEKDIEKAIPTKPRNLEIEKEIY